MRYYFLERYQSVNSAVTKYRGKRQAELTESEIEELDESEIDEVDHDMNMRMLQYGFEQLKESESSNAKGQRSSDKITRLWLNVGAFTRKATRSGGEGVLAKYWTYKGSLTTPG